jgi:hypothetical protein
VDRLTVRAEGGSGINFLGEENWKGTTVPPTVRYKQENGPQTKKKTKEYISIVGANAKKI